MPFFIFIGDSKKERNETNEIINRKIKGYPAKEEPSF